MLSDLRDCNDARLGGQRARRQHRDQDRCVRGTPRCCLARWWDHEQLPKACDVHCGEGVVAMRIRWCVVHHPRPTRGSPAGRMSERQAWCGALRPSFSGYGACKHTLLVMAPPPPWASRTRQLVVAVGSSIEGKCLDSTTLINASPHQADDERCVGGGVQAPMQHPGASGGGCCKPKSPLQQHPP